MNKIRIILLSYVVFMGNLAFAEPKLSLRFATEPTYPPFEYLDSQGQMQGFDIDIVKAICVAIAAECTFERQSFNGLIPSVMIGKFDAVIAAIGVTPERAREVDFTKSYYTPSGSYVGHLKDKGRLQDFQGAKIGVQEGTTFAKYARDKYDRQATIKPYISAQEALLDLVAGRIDVVLTDTAIAIEWLQNKNRNTQFGFIRSPITDPYYFGTGYAIAVRKNNKALLSLLNQGLKTIKRDGTYQTLIKKHFGPIKIETP